MKLSFTNGIKLSVTPFLLMYQLLSKLPFWWTYWQNTTVVIKEGCWKWTGIRTPSFLLWSNAFRHASKATIKGMYKRTFRVYLFSWIMSSGNVGYFRAFWPPTFGFNGCQSYELYELGSFSLSIEKRADVWIPTCLDYLCRLNHDS